jgi:hypothetical protein
MLLQFVQTNNQHWYTWHKTPFQFSLEFMKIVILLGNFALVHEYFILTRFYTNRCGPHSALQWLVYPTNWRALYSLFFLVGLQNLETLLDEMDVPNSQLSQLLTITRKRAISSFSWISSLNPLWEHPTSLLAALFRARGQHQREPSSSPFQGPSNRG